MARRRGYGYEQPRGRGLSLARVATIGVIAVLLVDIGFQCSRSRARRAGVSRARRV